MLKHITHGPTAALHSFSMAMRVVFLSVLETVLRATKAEFSQRPMLVRRGAELTSVETANSTIWTFAHNPKLNNLLIACSVSGQLYRSPDTGDSWTKLTHEFGEVRSLAVG